VSLATAPEHITASLVRCPEVMAHGVRGGAEAAELPATADVIVVGPGLGQAAWGQAVLQSALQSDAPLIVDADGLNLLARQWPDVRRDNWILTPHPGEAARLLGCSGRSARRRAGAAAGSRRRSGFERCGQFNRWPQWVGRLPLRKSWHGQWWYGRCAKRHAGCFGCTAW